jgi:Tol biopolymer transport system component
VSPDGRFLVYGAIVEGRNRFWLRALDELTGRALMNTTATESPFWSPDSTTLCFFADGKLKRISIASADAQPEILADAPQPHGGDWRGRTIVFARADGIYRLAVQESTAMARVTTVDASRGESQHGWPEFLPDGRRFLFIIRSSQPERSGLYLGSIDGAAPRRLMPASTRVRYVDGHLVFVRQGRLVAQRFDETSGAFTGEPVSLAERIKYHAASDAIFDVSRTGVLVYGQTTGEVTTQLTLFDDRGRELRRLTPAGYYRSPRFSPDGQRIVAEKIEGVDGNIDLWLYDIVRGSVSRLTSNAAPDVRAVWSPDGRSVVFSSKRGSLYDVYRKTVDTTEPEELLISGSGDKLVEHWSSDGRYLSGTVLRSGLWVFPVATGGKPWMVHADQKAETSQSEFSVDGRWLAYTSTESGSSEVYVEPVPATGERWQVSTHGGGEPHWRSDGTGLLYLGADGMLMSLPLAAGNWRRSSPVPLFRLSVPDLGGCGDYSVSPDGRRIVVNTFISDPVVPPIEVVVNWTRLLER